VETISVTIFNRMVGCEKVDTMTMNSGLKLTGYEAMTRTENCNR